MPSRGSNLRWCRMLIGAALVTTAGCASAHSGDTKQSVSPSRVQALIRGVSTNADFLAQVEVELTRRCMERAGWQFRPPPSPIVVPDAFTTAHLDVETAAADGYGLASHHTPASSAQDDYLGTLSEEQQKGYQLALFGDPNKYVQIVSGDQTIGIPGVGCQAEADRAIYGNLKQYAQLSNATLNIPRTSTQLFYTDTDLAAANESWSACMSERGYDYPSRFEARNRLASKRDELVAAQLAVAERTVAVADVACADKTGYERAITEAENRAQGKAFAQFESELVGMQELADSSVERAQAALNTPS